MLISNHENVAVLSSATRGNRLRPPPPIEEHLIMIKRDSSSYYFPDCRKDANCNCEMCLATCVYSGYGEEFGEKSSAVRDLNGKLRFLQKSLQGIVDVDKISNCSYANSRWEINQTAGLLATGISSRSFTIIFWQSHRVVGWKVSIRSEYMILEYQRSATLENPRLVFSSTSNIEIQGVKNTWQDEARCTGSSLLSRVTKTIISLPNTQPNGLCPIFSFL
ncbi:hypothetical protein F8388_024507 [Cannabis sativa]|uniref:Uncharacterized protein n=1 Tax=Cannabis sativa TaxID=3483 RepID=A0A7J6DZX9_CANSA|nr:hypothetical protein F8388_024507 [Cannabis sativa]